jgi:hypothetical protein
MYQTLFEVHYRHEYFGEQELLDLRVELSARSEKLLAACDLLVTHSFGHFIVRWNDDNTELAELLHDLSDEFLLFYFYPVQPELFYQVSAGFPQAMTYQQILGPEGAEIHTVKKTCASFYLFNYRASGPAALRGQAEATDKLYYIDSLDQLGRLDDVDLSQPPEPVYPDGDLSQLLGKAKRDSSIVLLVSLADWSAQQRPVKIVLNFAAKAYHYKYYLMSLPGDRAMAVKSNTISCTRGLEPVGNKADVTTFTTDAPVKLRHTPEQSFRLVNEVNGREESIIDELPHPKVENLYSHRLPDNKQVRVLEVFVH